MSTTDFVRSDGLTLPASQLSAYASVNNDGTEVTVHVWIAPPHGPVVSGAGEYIGTVALDDPRALGASVPVHVYVLYQNISLVLAVSFLAAFGGFTWAWLIHELGPGSAEYGILRNLALRVAVLLVATVPIVSAKVLADSGWQGSLSQYITLITIIGAAAIAATPTLRALVLPSSSRARAPRSDRTSG